MSEPAMHFMKFRWFLACLILALVAGPALAQDEEEPAEEQGDSSGSSGWGPRSGSFSGAARPPQMTTSGDDLTNGQVEPDEAAAEEDGRTELLVFDLSYEEGISFRDTYLDRFAESFEETVDASPVFRALTPLERQRRMTDAAQLMDPVVTDDRAEEIAEAIGVPYYLIPRVEIEDRSNYRISMTLGRAGEGDEGRHVYSTTAGRRVDYVDRAIERMTEQAMAAE